MSRERTCGVKAEKLDYCGRFCLAVSVSRCECVRTGRTLQKRVRDCVFGQFEDSITQVLQQLQQGVDCVSRGAESHILFFLSFRGDDVRF